MNHTMKMNRNFFLLLILTFFNAGAGMLTIIISLFFNDINIEIKTIGILIAFFGIGSFCGGYAGGHLSDILSGKNIIQISLIGTFIFLALFSFTTNIKLFAIYMLFVGFFNSGFRPASILLILSERGSLTPAKALSYRRVVLNLGFSFFAAGFGFLYDFAKQNSFVLISLLFVLNFLISLLLKINKESKIQQKETMQKPNFLLFIYLNILLIVGILVLDQTKMTYPLFLENIFKISINQISTLFTIHGVVVLLFQIPIGHFFDKLNFSLGCAIGCLFLAIGIGLTGFASSFKILIALCIIWTFGEMILFPTLLPFMLNSSIYKKGKTIGVYQASFSFGAFLAPIIGSFLYSKNPTLLWYACFALSVISTIIFLTFYKIYEKTSNSI